MTEMNASFKKLAHRKGWECHFFLVFSGYASAGKTFGATWPRTPDRPCRDEATMTNVPRPHPACEVVIGSYIAVLATIFKKKGWKLGLLEESA